MPTRKHLIWWVDGRTKHCVTVSVSLILEFISLCSCACAHTLTYSRTHISSSLKLKLCTKFITSDELKQNRHQKFESINEKNQYYTSAHERKFHILCSVLHRTTVLHIIIFGIGNMHAIWAIHEWSFLYIYTFSIL